MLPWLDNKQSPDQLRQLTIEKLRSQTRSPSIDPKILNLSISLTLLCNQGCQHCWVNAKNAIDSELSTEEIMSVLRQAKDLGAEHVKFTGGEPFTRKDILPILLFALGLGYRVSVETNGLLLKNKHLDLLTPYKEHILFFVSLDGAKAETHDIFRNSPGAYVKTLRTLKILATRHFNFSIHTVANKTNLQEIFPLYKIIRKMGALQHKVILSIHRLGRGHNIQDKSLDVEDVVWLTNELGGANFWDYRWQTDRETSDTLLMTTLPPAFQPPNNLNAITCGWSIDFCSILANGKVAMCHGAYEQEQVVGGNIRENSLETIWKYSHFFVKSRNYVHQDLKGICGNCAVASACRGLCRANALAEYGDILAPYPLCQVMYEKGLFPEYMLLDPDQDCSYTPSVNPRIAGKAQIIPIEGI